MTPDAFRRMALELPEAVESAHLGTPDFRVRGKIFATLREGDGARAVVKFSAEQQALFMHADPAGFAPVEGAWGRKGWTRMTLSVVNPARARDALVAAWRNVAPKRLAGSLSPTPTVED